MTSFWLQRRRSQKYMFLWVYINTSSDFSFGFVLLKCWCNIKIEKDCKCLKNVSLWINPFLAKFPFYTPCRSSRPEVLCKKGILRNFSKFTGKHLCQSLWVSRLWRRYFLVNFAKFLTPPFLTEHLQWLFLSIKTSEHRK